MLMITPLPVNSSNGVPSSPRILISWCVPAVGNILESLKESVNPCDDFAEFACGGWRREHPLPESKYSWGVLEIMDEKTLLDVQGRRGWGSGSDELVNKKINVREYKEHWNHTIQIRNNTRSRQLSNQ